MTDPALDLRLLCLDHRGALRALRSADGRSFVEAAPPAGVATHLPPAICRLDGGGFFVAFVAAGGRVMAGVSDDGVTFGWHEVPGATSSRPPAVATWRGSLCLAVTGEDEHVYLARAGEVADLALGLAHELATTRCGPRLAATPARLFVALTGQDGSPYLGTSDDGRTLALNALTMRAKTSVSVAAAACGNTLYLMARGDDEVPYLACSGDGPGLRFRPVGGGALTREAPSLAADGERVVCVLTGTDDGLYAGALEGGEVWFAPIEGAPRASRATSLAAPAGAAAPAASRSRVTVAFFVPDGASLDEARRAASASRVVEHLELAQRRYRAWIGADTFAFEPEPLVVRGRHPLGRYQGDAAWDAIADEVFAAAGENRYTAARVFVTLFVRPDDYAYGSRWKQMGCAGEAGGEGVGMVLMEYRSLFDDEPYPFQLTLVHELGHAFGLPHSDAWGEDMDSGVSIMSYNPRHHTKGLELGELAGELLPQELDHLAQNELVFPDFDR